MPAAQAVKRWKTENTGENRGKKRKRDEDVVAEGVLEDEESALPRTWDRELRRSGGCAVVVFVDNKSAQGAMKAVERAVRKGISVKWAEEDGLGLQSMFHSLVDLNYALTL